MYGNHDGKVDVLIVLANSITKNEQTNLPCTCTHVCIYMCMYVCMHVCVCVCVCVRMYVCVRVDTRMRYVVRESGPCPCVATLCVCVIRVTVDVCR